MKKEHGIIYKIYCKLVKAIVFILNCASPAEYKIVNDPFYIPWDDDDHYF